MNSKTDNPIMISGNSKLNDASPNGALRSHIDKIDGRSAELAPHATAATAAHEIGHGLGAIDKYHKEFDKAGNVIGTAPDAGHANTIMGDLKGKANPAQVDEIVIMGDKIVTCPPGVFATAKGC